MSLFGGVAYLNSTAQTEPSTTPITTQSTPQDATGYVISTPEPNIGNPISLLTASNIEPMTSNAGVTILTRSDFSSNQLQNSTDAPTAQGADVAHDFGIFLGKAQAFATLSARFGRIAKLNADLFHRLEPRALIVESENGLSALLLAGPFKSEHEAKKACDIINIPISIHCGTQMFDGELIARQ